jgi:hypothetical protein
MRWLVLTFSVSIALAADLALPEWLAPYPGASPSTQVSAGLVESSYTAEGTPADVAAHYQKELAAAGVTFQSNDDGMGIAMRASMPACDLLIRVRERGGVTFVSASCSEKSSAPAQVTYLPNGTGTTRPTSPGFPRDRAQMMAQARAQHDDHMTGMKKFDQPVQPQPQVPVVLKWPSWLVHMPSANHGLQIQRKKYESGLDYLESSYITSAPMTSIYDFYDSLLKENGFYVSGHVSTGSTSTHVQQNADGSVEGRLSPNGIGNGTLKIHVDFSRMFLNQPITVQLSVTAYPPGHY